MPQIFAIRLKELMEERGVTVKNLAEQVGVSQTTVRRFLRSEAFPKGRVLLLLAELFETRVNYLLGLDDLRKW